MGADSYAAGRRNVARNPPSGDGPSAIDPPYNSDEIGDDREAEARAWRGFIGAHASLQHGFPAAPVASPGPSSSTVVTT